MLNNFRAITLLFSVTYLMAIASRAEEVEAIVKIQAKEASLSKPTDTGRLSLLSEMQKYPEQLAKDLIRQDVVNLSIEGSLTPVKIIPKEEKKTAAELYQMIALRLFQNRAVELDLSKAAKNKLGKFWMAEVIYPIVRNFNLVPLEKYALEHPELASWAASVDEGARVWADIIYSPAKDTLTVTSNTEQKLIDTTGASSLKKRVLATSSAVFKLDSGKVNFSFSYSIDGLKKEWTSNKPF